MLNKRVIAIGNFDGVHLGHRAIVKETVRQARAKHADPCVLTFTPNPRAYFNPDHAPLTLMRLEEKADALGALGIREVIAATFDAAMAAVDAEAFAKDILARRLHACHVVTGENFMFGRGRKGNAALLRQWLKEAGVGVSIVKAVCDAQGVLSSSRVRAALAHGDMDAATLMLGHPYTIGGTVSHGKKRGRALGFPTLNIPLTERFLPKFGVYVVSIASSAGMCNGVANLGVNPTFGDTDPVLETHAFTPLPPLYGQHVRISLHRFLRPEHTFPNAGALADQIAKDVHTAKLWLEG